jgi:xylulokinase
MSLLGLDIGTTGCKAVLFRVDGKVLASAYQEYDFRSPQPGWAELDAPAVWAKVKDVLCSVAVTSPTDPPRAMAVSSLGEAVVPLTHQREILGPSLLNFDQRGREYLPSIRAQFTDEQLYAINGNTLGNHYTLTKLLWLRDHQPRLYEAAQVFLHWSGFTAYMLGAQPAVDYSLANRTLLFDLQKETWSAEILAKAGLDGSRLPQPVPSGVQIGALSHNLAAELGLPAGMAIVSGAHDQCANGVGCGILSAGQAMYGMGTYFCMMPAYCIRPPAQAMIPRGLNTEHHAVPGLFVSFIYNQGGALLKWYRDTFAAAEKAQARIEGRDIYADLIDEIPPGPGKVIILPHFVPTGPPDFISDSCGVIAGLRLETSRGDILRGILEGVTYYLRQCLESLPGTGIEIQTLRAVGGGSKSDAWVQLSADILGRPIERPANPEAGALGAAILAGTAVGEFSSLAEGCQAMIQIERDFSPDPARHRSYSDKFEHYRRLWPHMAEYLRDIAAA